MLEFAQIKVVKKPPDKIIYVCIVVYSVERFRDIELKICITSDFFATKFTLTEMAFWPEVAYQLKFVFMGDLAFQVMLNQRSC
jgi:hypothetical protein